MYLEHYLSYLNNRKKIKLSIILLGGQSIHLLVTFTTGIILTSNLKLTSLTCSLEEKNEILVIILGKHYNCFHITSTTNILLTSYFNLVLLVDN